MDEDALQPSAEFVAHHEAGHAVVAAALGCRVLLATIEPDNGRLGRVVTAPSPDELAKVRPSDFAVVLLAGPVSSDCLLSGQPLGEFFGGGSEDDRRLAFRADRDGYEANLTRAVEILQSRAETRQWLAAKLMDHGTLNAADLAELLGGGSPLESGEAK